MNVSLTPELERYVRAKVKSGYYNNASEVIREALREMILLEPAPRRRDKSGGGLQETPSTYRPQKLEKPRKAQEVERSAAQAEANARALERLRAEIQKGIDSPDDPEFSFDKLRASLNKGRRRRAA
jgi:Arc/MetJ-type ribon-helix-helix transcriptional regulator